MVKRMVSNNKKLYSLNPAKEWHFPQTGPTARFLNNQELLRNSGSENKSRILPNSPLNLNNYDVTLNKVRSTTRRFCKNLSFILMFHKNYINRQ